MRKDPEATDPGPGTADERQAGVQQDRRRVTHPSVNSIHGSAGKIRPAGGKAGRAGPPLELTQASAAGNVIRSPAQSGSLSISSSLASLLSFGSSSAEESLLMLHLPFLGGPEVPAKAISPGCYVQERCHDCNLAAIFGYRYPITTGFMA